MVRLRVGITKAVYINLNYSSGHRNMKAKLLK